MCLYLFNGEFSHCFLCCVAVNHDVTQEPRHRCGMYLCRLLLAACPRSLKRSAICVRVKLLGHALACVPYLRT